MDKVWNILNYPKDELIKDVMNTLGVSKSIAEGKINNGKIRPSSTKSHFHFFVPGYKYPILVVKSENLWFSAGGFIDIFIDDYKWLNRFYNNKYSNDKKKVNMMTGVAMKGLWGKPEMLNKAINEIKTYLVTAEVDKIIDKKIADMTISNYHKLLETYDFRFGRGIRGEWGTIRLMLKWAERINFKEYIQIRDSLKIEDWENMITFETALAKKRPEYEPVDVLKKDRYFAHIFQYDILKDVIEGYDDEFAERLITSTAWVTKNIFRFLHKADWLGVTNLWVIGELDCFIFSKRMARPEKFRKEFSIPKRSFYRQREKFKQFIESNLPGQPYTKGSFDLDPPTYFDIF